MKSGDVPSGAFGRNTVQETHSSQLFLKTCLGGCVRNTVNRNAFVGCEVAVDKLEVVLADLGCADFAWPEERFGWKTLPADQIVAICNVQYRAPDMLLGSQRFGPDLDMWPLGCVAAELSIREPLFQPPAERSLAERSLLDAHFAFLGTPPKGASTHA